MKPLNLALQGGGSHGAFTWGVLDCLLEDGQCDISAVSGASAGAMNAIALVHALADEAVSRPARYEQARASLKNLWDAICAIRPPAMPDRAGMAAMAATMPQPAVDAMRNWLDPAAFAKLGNVFGQGMPGMPSFPDLSAANNAAGAASTTMPAWLAMLRHLSPQQFNPHNVNPLRDILNEQIDFERIRHVQPVPLLVSATRVDTARLKIFREHEITAEMILASSCLPALYHTLVIDGHPYWDGGLSANPPLLPLQDVSAVADTLMVLLQPAALAGVPDRADKIRERLIQLAFRTSLHTELQVFAMTQRSLMSAGSTARQHYLHAIEGGGLTSQFEAGSHLNTSPEFIARLFKAGRASAQTWLDAHQDDIGQRGSVDLDAYLPDYLQQPE